MDIRRLDKKFTVSGQISAAEVAQLARLGVTSLICNRPDGESGDQPGFQEIAQAAEAQEERELAAVPAARLLGPSQAGKERERQRRPDARSPEGVQCSLRSMGLRVSTPRSRPSGQSTSGSTVTAVP